MEEVRRSLEMKLPETILRLEMAFTSAGYQLYVVGGAVRDAVLGIEPKDFDLATNATPKQVTDLIVNLLPKWSADLTGEAFGVVRTLPPREYWATVNSELRELCEHEIATFREDITAGRHPEVRFATIKEDVQRRDLTINALFYDIQRQEIVDLVSGLRDLDDGIVRMVGRPADRFAEDRLRIMRAIRFATRFGYMMSEETERAILEDNSLEGISPERIRDEFVRSIESAQDVRVLFGLYTYFGLWEKIFPGLNVAPTMVIDRKVSPEVAMALIFEQNDSALVKRRLNALKYSENESRQVGFLMDFRQLDFAGAYRMRKLANSIQIAADQINDYVENRMLPAPRMAAKFLKYQPTVKGDDLMALGFSGPALGKELERRELELFKRLFE